MGYQSNPFDEEEGMEFNPQDLLAGLSPVRLGSTGELIKIFGLRESKITLDISRENERGPDRDATMLEAILSTTLEPETMSKLCSIIYSKYIAPVVAQIKDQPKPTPKKRRPRKDVSNPFDQ